MIELSDPITYFEFTQSCNISIIHFWAEWNASDYLMKDKLKQLETSYSGRIYFASVNVDKEEMSQIFKEVKIVNVPALAYYKKGNYVETVIGLIQPIEEKLDKLNQGMLYIIE